MKTFLEPSEKATRKKKYVAKYDFLFVYFDKKRVVLEKLDALKFNGVYEQVTLGDEKKIKENYGKR